MKKRNFSIPAFFTEQYIEKIAAYEDVESVYGSLSKCVLGTARESKRLPNASLEDLKTIVKACHGHDIRFNYALNNPTYGISQNDRDALVNHVIPTLESADVDAVIVSSPLLMMDIEDNSELNIIVSTISRVSSLHMIKEYTSKFKKVIKIVLDIYHNRDFKLLKNIMESGHSKYVEMVVNECCIKDCIYRNSHYMLQSCNAKLPINYPYEFCTKTLFSNFPTNFLKTPFVRPEDLAIYRVRYGIEHLKITGRTTTEELILNTLKAYNAEKFEGNLLELFPIVYYKIQSEKSPQHGKFIDNKSLELFTNLVHSKDFSCITDCGSRCNICEHRRGVEYSE